MVEHIVLYRLRDGADGEALGETLRTLIEVDGVREMSCGPNSSRLGLSGAWDYGLHVRFDDEAARERYMTDPRHLAVVPAVEALTADLVVFGITTEEG
jgi:hypothetical protein